MIRLSRKSHGYPTKDDSVAKFYLHVTGARNIHDLVNVMRIHQCSITLRCSQKLQVHHQRTNSLACVYCKDVHTMINSNQSMSRRIDQRHEIKSVYCGLRLLDISSTICGNAMLMQYEGD
jgi:hypothetical protein